MEAVEYCITIDWGAVLSAIGYIFLGAICVIVIIAFMFASTSLFNP